MTGLFERLVSLVVSSLVLVVSVEGCGVDNPAGVVENNLATRAGVDYSFARPTPSSLRAAGYTFASRYVSDFPEKNMSKSETDALRAGGVDVVTNWENDGDNEILNGYSSGVYAAQTGQSLARAAGMPSGRPIYFSVDFDAQPSQQPALDAFFDGAASVLGRSRVGAYGSYGVIKRLFDAGKITYGWQTYAWSYGNWEPRAQVRQVDNGAACDGGCDIDQAIAADFGQWGAVQEIDPCANIADGTYCGGNGPAGDASTLYRCAGGKRTTREVCSAGCQASPTGGLDECFGAQGLAAVAFESSVNVFGLNASAQAEQNYTEGASWNGWADLGGAFAGRISAVSFNNSLNVFARGTDGHIYQRYSMGAAWSAWRSLGGSFAADPVAVVFKGSINVFALGQNNQLYQSYSEGATWSAWRSLGGGFAGTPAVLRFEDSINVFVRGANGNLYQTYSMGATWSAWSNRGGPFVGNPAATRLGDSVNVFMRAPDGTLRQIYSRGASWSPWVNLGGSFDGNPAVVTYKDSINLFIRGGNNSLYQKYSTGAAWSPWVNLGGSFSGDAAAVTYKDSLNLFIRTTGGSLYQRYTSSASWSNWLNLGGLGAF